MLNPSHEFFSLFPFFFFFFFAWMHWSYLMQNLASFLLHQLICTAHQCHFVTRGQGSKTPVSSETWQIMYMKEIDSCQTIRSEMDCDGGECSSLCKNIIQIQIFKFPVVAKPSKLSRILETPVQSSHSRQLTSSRWHLLQSPGSFCLLPSGEPARHAW